MKKKSLVAAALLVSMAVMLGACGGSANSASSQSVAEAEASDVEPEEDEEPEKEAAEDIEEAENAEVEEGTQEDVTGTTERTGDFDEATNVTKQLDNFAYQIPAAWIENCIEESESEFGYVLYMEKGWFAFDYYMDFAGDYAGLTADEVFTSFDFEPGDYTKSTATIAGQDAVRFSMEASSFYGDIRYEELLWVDDGGYYELGIYYLIEDGAVGIYDDDFEKIVASVELQ